jgi:hypothetical protein
VVITLHARIHHASGITAQTARTGNGPPPHTYGDVRDEVVRHRGCRLPEVVAHHVALLKAVCACALASTSQPPAARVAVCFGGRVTRGGLARATTGPLARILGAVVTSTSGVVAAARFFAAGILVFGVVIIIIIVAVVVVVVVVVVIVVVLVVVVVVVVVVILNNHLPIAIVAVGFVVALCTILIVAVVNVPSL